MMIPIYNRTVEWNTLRFKEIGGYGWLGQKYTYIYIFVCVTSLRRGCTCPPFGIKFIQGDTSSVSKYQHVDRTQAEYKCNEHVKTSRSFSAMIQHASRSHAALSDQLDQPGDSDEEMAPEEMSELKGFNMPLLLGQWMSLASASVFIHGSRNPRRILEVSSDF